jgi:hypothetical protein
MLRVNQIKNRVKTKSAKHGSYVNYKKRGDTTAC